MEQRFFYCHRCVLTTEPSIGMLTIALLVSHSGAVYFGEAWCSPKDNFNRKLGRKIAEGRARSRLKKRFPSDLLSLIDRTSERIDRKWLMEKFARAAKRCKRPRWAKDCRIVDVESLKDEDE